MTIGLSLRIRHFQLKYSNCSRVYTKIYEHIRLKCHKAAQRNLYAEFNRWRNRQVIPTSSTFQLLIESVLYQNLW